MTTQAYFENIQQEIIKQIDSAQESILVALAWITDKHIFKKLCDKAEQGRQVELLVFESVKNDTSYFDHRELEISGGKLCEIKQHDDGGIMHHKFCVIDGHTVINGSYNWSKHAQNNRENIQITSDNVELANQFKKEFDAIKEQYIIERLPRTKEEEESFQELKEKVAREKRHLENIKDLDPANRNLRIVMISSLLGTSLERFPSNCWIDGNRTYLVNIQESQRNEILAAAGVERSNDLMQMKEDCRNVQLYALLGTKIRAQRATTQEERLINPDKLYVECKPDKVEVVLKVSDTERGLFDQFGSIEEVAAMEKWKTANGILSKAFEDAVAAEERKIIQRQKLANLNAKKLAQRNKQTL